MLGGHAYTARCSLGEGLAALSQPQEQANKIFRDEYVSHTGSGGVGQGVGVALEYHRAEPPEEEVSRAAEGGQEGEETIYGAAVHRSS